VSVLYFGIKGASNIWSWLNTSNFPMQDCKEFPRLCRARQENLVECVSPSGPQTALHEKPSCCCVKYSHIHGFRSTLENCCHFAQPAAISRNVTWICCARRNLFFNYMQRCCSSLGPNSS